MVLVAHSTQSTKFTIAASTLFNMLEKGGEITQESIDLAHEREGVRVRKVIDSLWGGLAFLGAW